MTRNAAQPQMRQTYTLLTYQLSLLSSVGQDPTTAMINDRSRAVQP